MPRSKRPDDRKPKKRAPIRTTRSESDQQNIPHLFKASQEADTVDGPSPSKRPKLDHSALQEGTGLPNAIKLGQMYNFQKPNQIDLINGDGPAKTITVSRKHNGIIRPSNTSSQTGPKRLEVKNARLNSKTDPDEYFNQVWVKLDATLSAIMANEKIAYPLEELYKGVEILCRQGRAPLLFKHLGEKCKQGLISLYERPLMELASRVGCSDVEILRAVVESWSRWNAQTRTIRSIFFYMDRSYLLHSSTLPSLEEMSFSKFYDHIFLVNSSLRSRILGGSCELMAADRNGHYTLENRGLFCEAVKMFHILSVYTSDFEPMLLAQSEKFFTSWFEEKMNNLNLAQFVEETQSLINEEIQRCEKYGLDSTTRKTLENYIEDYLLGQRLDRLLLTEDISELLQNNADTTLKILYVLLERKGFGEKLRPPFESYIIEEGSRIIFDEKREQDMVLRLLAFKKKLDRIWERSFVMHEGLGHTLREAFETFINKSKRSNMTWGTDNPKPGEMIAKHVDLILKGGSKTLFAAASSAERVSHEEDGDASSGDEDAETNRRLDEVLDLFRFVHGKAVFEAFYKRDLARRLLLNRSASADAEKSMLTRLKSECGAGFTHNLEQMFKDMELAREEVSSFKLMLEERQSKPSIDLNVSVLSASAWPTYPDVPIEIPQNVQQAALGFEKHYKMKHTGRKLAWKHSLAHCQLKASFPKAPKELVVSSYQAVVLLQFNDQSTSDRVPYLQIQGATGLDDAELKRTLQSLACAKYRVLSKLPKGKEVNDSDTFTVNASFSDPKYRIKINQIQAKETKEENKETHERVAADRNYETQAAIVRIMKSKKTITHPQLVAEVISATKSRGVLDPADIKKNIEKLIEKEYMEREEGRNAYTYLA